MKKHIILIVVISLTLSLLSSCGKKDGTEIDFGIDDIEMSFTTEDNNFLYEIESHIPLLFTVDDNGVLYYLESAPSPVTVVVLGLDGEKIEEAELEPYWIIDENEEPSINPDGVAGVSCIAVKNSVLYIAGYTSYPSENTEIHSYNFNTGEQKKIIGIEGFHDVRKIIPLENKIYLLGIDRELNRSARPVGTHDYYGEVIICADIKTGEYEAVFSDMPYMMAKTEDGGIMLCAYDENNGYYFQNLSSGEKLINNHFFSRTDEPNFEMYGFSNVIHDSDNFLMFLPLDGSRAARDIITNLQQTTSSKYFTVKSGHLFYYTDNGIRRILLSELFKSPVNLTIARTNPYNPNMPPPVLEKLGFGINFSFVDYYDFALSLLSLDNKYDMYYLDSWYDVSDNIRRKGAFYPLNDVPFVQEYIDAVFPYVKEAAVNENGDIWMIPLGLSAKAFFYNEKLCEEYEIDVDQLKTMEDIVRLALDLRDMEPDAAYYIIHPEEFFNTFFYQLIRKHNGFDRDDFRMMAEYFYENMNYIKDDWIIQNYDHGDMIIKVEGGTRLDFRYRFLFQSWTVGTYLHEDFKEALESVDYDDEMFFKLISDFSFKTTWYNYLHNRFMPFLPTASIEDMNENSVRVAFIAVNPNSKYLDIVLEYISALCEYQLSLENSFILKDKSTYADRFFVNDAYDIISNKGNYIAFSVDSEFIYSDLEKFLGDEISLDEYLNKIEFKINAYLNE